MEHDALDLLEAPFVVVFLVDEHHQALTEVDDTGLELEQCPPDADDVDQAPDDAPEAGQDDAECCQDSTGGDDECDRLHHSAAPSQTTPSTVPVISTHSPSVMDTPVPSHVVFELDADGAAASRATPIREPSAELRPL